MRPLKRISRRTLISKQSGSALLGALAAVTIAGVVGVGMVSSYDSFQKQSRVAYVRAAMTSLDNRVRFMAMQPYAYQCGSDNGATALEGVASCKITPGYFDDVAHVVLAGAPCAPPNVSCGFELITSGTDKDGRPYGYYTAPVPDASGTPVTTGFFSYRLNYQGTDFSLAPGGLDLDAGKKQIGMMIPREVLQSQSFDCAVATNGLKPIFQGFDAAGKVKCREFNTCPAGQYVSEVNFVAGTVKCVSFGETGNTIDCTPTPPRQLMISRVRWAGSGQKNLIETNPGAVCADLPVPPISGTVTTSGPTPSAANPAPTPINGACGGANGVSSTTAPSSNLCSSGTATPVTKTASTWSWQCSGQNGGSSASCSAPVTQGPLTWNRVPGAVNGLGKERCPTYPFQPVGQSCSTLNKRCVMPMGGGRGGDNGSYVYQCCVSGACDMYTWTY